MHINGITDIEMGNEMAFALEAVLVLTTSLPPGKDLRYSLLKPKIFPNMPFPLLVSSIVLAANPPYHHPPSPMALQFSRRSHQAFPLLQNFPHVPIAPRKLAWKNFHQLFMYQIIHVPGRSSDRGKIIQTDVNIGYSFRHNQPKEQGTGMTYIHISEMHSLLFCILHRRW